MLDLGTGTGVLPRNMNKYGANWIGIDISDNQIAEAKRLALENRCNNVEFITSSVEECYFDNGNLISLLPVSLFGILTMMS